MCMREDFFEIYRQFGHAPSKSFASPDVVRSHWAVLNCMFTGLANQFVTCPTRDSLQGITITNTSCTQSIPIGQAFVTSPKSYLLTPWCRVLPEELTGLQLVKKFPAFHGTRRFISALTSVRHLSLSWASLIQFILPHPTS